MSVRLALLASFLLLLSTCNISACPREVGLAAVFTMVSGEGMYIAFHKRDASNLEQSAGITMFGLGIVGILYIPTIIRLFDRS